MSERRTSPRPSFNSSSSTRSSTLSSNSSREGSSGNTSSTSVSSGNDSGNSQQIPCRKGVAKPVSPPPMLEVQTTEKNGNARSSESSMNKSGRQRSVTAFLNKLFRMVSETITNDLIHWSSDGKSFIVEHQDDFSKTLLPRYFKHNTFASFVRQLNMYNFHKVPHVEQRTLITDTTKDIWEFSNPNFQCGRTDLLSFVYRKRIQEREQSKSESSIHSLLQTSQAIRQKQSTLSSEILTLKSDFQSLWKDTLTVREQQQERQEAFIKIIQLMSYLTRHSLQTNSGESTLAEDLPRKFLACPDTNKLLNLAQQHSLSQYQPSATSSAWPVQPMITYMPTNMSEEEVNNTLASTLRSVTAIATDIETLNRNVELLAKKYSYGFDTDELQFGPNLPIASFHHNHNDNELNIIQYQHTGKRPSQALEDDNPSKKRAGSIGHPTSPQQQPPPPSTSSNSADPWTTPHVFKTEIDPMQPLAMPTIAMRRATARAVPSPILGETSLADRFQPQAHLNYTAAVSTIVPFLAAADAESGLVDMTDSSSFVRNQTINMGCEDSFGSCDYGAHDDIDEFSGFFGPPSP